MFGQRKNTKTTKTSSTRFQQKSKDSELDDEPLKLQPIKRYAVWLLSRQDYSSKDLEDRFKRKGYSDEDIQTCMTFLHENSFQSDERFAGNRAKSKSRLHGDRRIKMDLKQKGIDDETVNAAVEELDSEEDRVIIAAKKFEGKELDKDLEMKIWRFLAARGFGSSSIKKAISYLKNPDQE